ncbi:MAG: hypothetical protein V4671_26230, partial [Armatimonadota bacterium]
MNPIGNSLDHYEVLTDYAVFHPTGEVTLAEAVELVTQAIVLTRTQEIRKLFVSTLGLTGFPVPTLAERFFLIGEWAEASRGMVRVAMVARPEIIDPEKIGVLMGNNRGFNAEIF